MILDDIIKDRRIAVEAAKKNISTKEILKRIDESSYHGISFKEALLSTEKTNGVKIIAEVKKASPSKGLICKEFKYLEIAKAYEKGGASAISVLTEPKYFQGDNRYLSEIKQSVNLPILRKDFIIDDYQIYEAKAIGADCILLIVAALEQSELTLFMKIAKSLGLDCLVETHNEEEVKRALEAGAEIVGVNNRNLKNFEVSLATSQRLRELIPADKVFVSESGIHTEADIQFVKKLGANAVLIGESVVKSENPAKQLEIFIEAGKS